MGGEGDTGFKTYGARSKSVENPSDHQMHDTESGQLCFHRCLNGGCALSGIYSEMQNMLL